MMSALAHRLGFGKLTIRRNDIVTRQSHRALRMQDHLAHRLPAGEHFQCVGGLR